MRAKPLGKEDISTGGGSPWCHGPSVNQNDGHGNYLFIRLKTIHKNDSYKSCCFDYRLWMHWNKGFRKWFPTYHQNLSVYNDFTASLFHCFWLTAPCYFIHRFDFDSQLIFSCTAELRLHSPRPARGAAIDTQKTRNVSAVTLIMSYRILCTLHRALGVVGLKPFS